MSILVAILGIVLPIVTFFVSPTKTIGRGGKWVLVGGALLVGTMMLLFFDVRGFMSDVTTADSADASALSDADADASALQAIFGAAN